MSSPFIFTPPISGQPPELHPSPYLFEYYNRPRISPYIPSLDFSGPNTPISPVGTFDDDLYSPPLRHRRPPSWHAGMGPPDLSPYSNYEGPSPPIHALGLPPDYHSRRRSIDGRLYHDPAAYYPPVDPYFLHHNMGSTYPGRLKVHPLLDGSTRYPPILFDLSAPSFEPLEIVGVGGPHPISTQVLAQTATESATTRLAITCDMIPQWPIYLEHNTPGYHMGPGLTPITVGDILYAIHFSLQTQISHAEWDEFSDPDTRLVVARAYRRRCRSFPAAELLPSQGVRRVDYLAKHCMFAGLIPAPGDDRFENIKLVLSQRQR